MSNFTKTFTKMIKRKKRNGYYEASDILTSEEKINLTIAFSVLLVPIIIGVAMLAINIL